MDEVAPTVLNPLVFAPGPQFYLPWTFFNFMAEEVRQEQRLRSQDMEGWSGLQTKAHRKKKS